VSKSRGIFYFLGVGGREGLFYFNLFPWIVHPSLKKYSSNNVFATHAVAGGSFFAAKKGTKKPRGCRPRPAVRAPTPVTNKYVTALLSALSAQRRLNSRYAQT
jgi:hypothetical protein